MWNRFHSIIPGVILNASPQSRQRKADTCVKDLCEGFLTESNLRLAPGLFPAFLKSRDRPGHFHESSAQNFPTERVKNTRALKTAHFSGLQQVLDVRKTTTSQQSLRKRRSLRTGSRPLPKQSVPWKVGRGTWTEKGVYRESMNNVFYSTSRRMTLH